MSRVTVMFELDEAVLARLQVIARGAQTDVGALVRRAIDRDLKRQTASGEDSEPVIPLAALQDDIDTAQTWADLRTRLAARGVVLRRRDGGLALVRQSNGSTICDATDLGSSVTGLMRRFGAPKVPPLHGYLDALSAVSPNKN